MRTLSIFRHAKSDWNNDGQRDFDRPLARRGEEAAPRMGDFMARHGIAPDLILCSSAKRARQTLKLALANMQCGAEIEFDDKIYEADTDDLMACVRAAGNGFRHIMLIGHNPSMQALALRLANPHHGKDVATLATKFPTAGLAVIAFDAPQWSDIGPGQGKLDIFMVPKRLPL